MSRPSAFTYLIGNFVSLVGFWIASLYCLYQSFMHGLSPVVTVLVFAFMLNAQNASGQIEKFNRWQQEWKGMGPQRAKPRFSLLSILFPGFGLIARLFRSKPKAQKDVAVTVCVGRPLLATGMMNTYRALPEYCLNLLAPARPAQD